MINSFPNQHSQSIGKYNGVNSPIHNSSKTLKYLMGKVQDLHEDNSKTVLKNRMKAESLTMFLDRII